MKMMKQHLPLPAAFHRDEDEDLRSEMDPLRGSGVEERARVLESLCRMAAEMAAQHPDPLRVFEWQDPLPANSREVLERLRAEFRARG
ncbi:MAG: hypothetical protein HY897_10800 [Deltaproteobacteria bacterium]|nr:hypothetical protein [Deltaproteobacteria bacterium]